MYFYIDLHLWQSSSRGDKVMLITMDDKTPFIMIASQENDRNWEEMKRDREGKFWILKYLSSSKTSQNIFVLLKLSSFIELDMPCI